MGPPGEFSDAKLTNVRDNLKLVKLHWTPVLKC